MNTKPRGNENPLNICLISYRSNPHSGGQGVYLKNLSRALKDLGHGVDILSGPPDPLIDPDIPLVTLPCLDLYNPEDPFRIPSLKELSNPINLLEWLDISAMGYPEPMTFGMRVNRHLKGNEDNTQYRFAFHVAHINFQLHRNHRGGS